MQLYDQHGTPITTRVHEGPFWGYDEITGENIVYVPNELTVGGNEWSTFPLAEARSIDPYDPEALASSSEAPRWPYSERAPLNAMCAVGQDDGDDLGGDSGSSEGNGSDGDSAPSEAGGSAAPNDAGGGSA